MLVLSQLLNNAMAVIWSQRVPDNFQWSGCHADLGADTDGDFGLAAGAPAMHCPAMLRPDKNYSVFDLRQLKGKRCLTHIHVKSPEEAAAAEAAGIDLLSCSFDSAEAQARLPLLVAAAPKSFISAATPHGMASPEEAIRVGFQALELGASSVYCSASPWMIEAMARERIPVVGHLGMVPRHATWTNVRAIGKTATEAVQLYEQMKRLENAGAYAAELELVPHRLASYLCTKTALFLMSLGSGSGCDSQFLFSERYPGRLRRTHSPPRQTVQELPQRISTASGRAHRRVQGIRR